MSPFIPFRALAKSLATTIIFFALAELAIRGAYFVRNAMVDYVPLPYAFGDHYGPLPPWLDSLQILQDDETLIWKNAPNVQRNYLDVFSPMPYKAGRNINPTLNGDKRPLRGREPVGWPSAR